ncbi:MAG TPA: hypothetical protein VJ974_08845 [Geopsychrobacteraceae bacterium]|nr:hypothetical protein [Geopsychrobacteraceae bacterium]
MLNRSHYRTNPQRLPSQGCPDYEYARQVCQASIGQIIPTRRQQMRYCASDDYDNCPIYLGKALRSCRTQGLDRDALIDSGK